ncbi:MAG: 5'/3'-nucleotidase SurE [Gammaproteobacteria bacterium RIFCSPHIGHO2_02_FULL_42_13]|nr:MAG: 5'/3'-nucleotidase SurE [Gammaproteobacteria bacterium RIFCSPHIGHO2_02_FULL_42_13]
MKILISNDDGCQSPGILCLAKVLKEIADVVIAAPDRNRSGASNSLTLDRPLRVKEMDENHYSITGTPTDCVHVAVSTLLDELPNMIVSGINQGPNLGDDILYSGTVAAAIEGRSLGLPSIAVSLNFPAVHYETAAQVAKNLVIKLAKGSLPSHTILNVNVPDVPLSELGKYEITRLGTRHRAQPCIKQQDPRGHDIYWIGELGPEADAGAGTDFHAVRAGHVSVTPLRLDWTDFKSFNHVAEWLRDPN